MAISFSNFNAWILSNPSSSSSSSSSDCNPNPSTNPNPNPTPNPNSNFPVYSADSFAALDVEAYSYPKQASPKIYSRKTSRKTGRRRRNQSLDLDFDMVLVPSDYSFSGSESEGSDWSIGWFEPHAPDFCGGVDAEPENSFAVLVPCYGSSSPHSLINGRAPGLPDHDYPQDIDLSPNPSCFDTANSKSQLWAAVLSNIAKDPYAETNHYLHQWLSSLQS